MKSLVLLHNTGDLKELQQLAGLAADDSAFTGFRPWLDRPDTSDSGIDTLDSSRPHDEQIKERIANADAIVYCVGNTGGGPYQERVEAGLVEQAVQSRRSTDNPIRFIPVILKQGSDESLPGWARRYTIVNRDRTLDRYPPLWARIKQRLLATPEVISDSAVPKPLPGSDQIQRIVRALRDRPQLSVFIGPYALDAYDSAPLGPAAVTRAILKNVGRTMEDDSAIPPWPSEAAEWLRFTDSLRDVHDVLRKRLAPLGHHPPELARSIGELAEMDRSLS